ncbi:GntR family transcriptional regulator [Pseudorhodoplanes sp.]|uniref:GntR family transcriptional regulator n=1 Tax=Pseudorhodoplanes sp. TaxID=1934341 RepID=UPI003D148999
MTLLVLRSTLADQAFECLTDAIVRGELFPGAALSELEIAAKLGISRGPAREAIHRLEAKGLVTRSPHLGARVVELKLEDVRELFQMREALEGMTCRLAAITMSDSDLDALASNLVAHSQQPELAAGESYYQPGGDNDFHFRIARGSGNTRLIRALCDDLYHVMRVYRFRSSTQAGRARQALGEHQGIAAALRARDPDAAEARMREHIRQSWKSTEALASSQINP